MWYLERTVCAMKEESWAGKRLTYLYTSRYAKLYATRSSGYATSALSADEIYFWENATWIFSGRQRYFLQKAYACGNPVLFTSMQGLLDTCSSSNKSMICLLSSELAPSRYLDTSKTLEIFSRPWICFSSGKNIAWNCNASWYPPSAERLNNSVCLICWALLYRRDYQAPRLSLRLHGKGENQQTIQKTVRRLTCITTDHIDFTHDLFKFSNKTKSKADNYEVERVVEWLALTDIKTFWSWRQRSM